MENLQSQKKKIFVTTVSIYKTENTKIVIIRKKKNVTNKNVLSLTINRNFPLMTL